LDTNFSSIIKVKETNNRFGYSFGHCSSICGSFGIVSVSGLDQLVPDIASARAQFSTCGVTDEAILSVPVSALLDFGLVVRASGQGLVWPSTALSYTTEVDASAQLSGEIVFTVPMKKSKTLFFSDLQVDIHFTSSWTSAANAAWPDQTSTLFDRLPLNDFIDSWTSELNTSFSPQLISNVKSIMLVPNISIACNMPRFVPMPCTLAMKQSLELPTAPCHPCDTCCKCFVQQRCDSGCAECACLSCTQVQRTFAQAAISSLFIVFSVYIFWNCYKKTFF